QLQAHQRIAPQLEEIRIAAHTATLQQLAPDSRQHLLAKPQGPLEALFSSRAVRTRQPGEIHSAVRQPRNARHRHDRRGQATRPRPTPQLRERFGPQLSLGAVKSAVSYNLPRSSKGLLTLHRHVAYCAMPPEQFLNPFQTGLLLRIRLPRTDLQG